MAGTNGTVNGAAKMNGGNGTLKGALNGTSVGRKCTDRTRWRLHNDRGCHIWRYLDSEEEAKKWPQSTADKWYLGLDTVGRPQELLYNGACYVIARING